MDALCKNKNCLDPYNTDLYIFVSLSSIISEQILQKSSIHSLLKSHTNRKPCIYLLEAD